MASCFIQIQCSASCQYSQSDRGISEVAIAAGVGCSTQCQCAGDESGPIFYRVCISEIAQHLDRILQAHLTAPLE